MLPRWVPVAFIPLLALIFFFPLVPHPTQVLYSDHSDLLAEHVPAKRFLVRSFQETGKLPLWCPYLYGGSPFVHDIQVAVFYPLHLPLLFISEESVGAYLSWLVVLHLILAGWLAYAYARFRGLLPLPALVAAAGYMFAGKWMPHLLGGGHTITLGLAWLPLVLHWLERAIRGGGLLWATGTGVVYGLIVLSTHPQWTFYAGLFAALWTLGAALQEAGHFGGEGPRGRRRTWAALARWGGYGAWVVVAAVALSAVQLLPTLEAARHTTRAAGMAPEPVAESLQTLLFLVGPTMMARPAMLIWENRAGLALLWLVAVVLAPILRGGRVRYEATLCLGLLLFGAGGAWLSRWLPGFHLFRQHPRILIVAWFGVAYLAGVATQALFFAGALSPSLQRLCFRVAIGLGLLTVLLCGGFALGMVLAKQPLCPHAYWVVLPVVFVLACAMLRRESQGRKAALIWALLLLADLWALSWPLVEVRPGAEVFRAPACVRFLAEQENRGRVLDVYYYDEDDRWVGSPLGQGAPLAPVHSLEAVRGFNPLDKLHYREYLHFIADDGRPVRALDGPLTYPVTGYFRLVNRPLLDLLGVRYLLLPDGERPPGEGWKAVFRDPAPVAYNIYLGGMRKLAPYTVYENLRAYPRAFVVPRAAPLPKRPRVLAALKETDFRETVLLEGLSAQRSESSAGATYRPAKIDTYLPNRVALTAEADAPGYLVLADVWYPGWTCTVNGEPTTVYRANYLFRAVKVPAGKSEVVFRFEPASYRIGRLVSGVALAAVAFLTLALSVLHWQRGVRVPTA